MATNLTEPNRDLDYIKGYKPFKMIKRKVVIWQEPIKTGAGKYHVAHSKH